MPAIADIKNWIDYDPKIGVEGCHIYGFPGSGKSNLGNLLFKKCVKGSKDFGLMRGDLFAEWRHLTCHDMPIKLCIPEPLVGQIDYIGFNKEDYPTETFNPKKFNVMHHLKEGHTTVFYDAGFTLPSKGWFWANIFEQLIMRKIHIKNVITFLDHEAGVLFPELALSESKAAKSHWRAVNKVCEVFVFFRKALIRPILISQLDSEINHRIRLKCHYTVIKRGGAGRMMPDKVQKETPKQRIDQFTVVCGREVYTRYNDAKKFKEVDDVWKMLPNELINPYMDDIDKKDLPTHICNNCGYRYKAVATRPKKCPECQRRGTVELIFSAKEEDLPPPLPGLGVTD